MHHKGDLPPIPARLLSLPIQNGYPIPWFVAEIDGNYDFRISDAAKIKPAIKDKLCWICGQKLGSYLAFPIGPMCVINRIIAEPPSHTECAEWAIKACPFLAQKQEYRRTSHLPENIKEPPGIAIKRQPGAIALWTTKHYSILQLENGLLFKLGQKPHG